MDFDIQQKRFHIFTKREQELDTSSEIVSGGERIRKESSLRLKDEKDLWRLQLQLRFISLIAILIF